MVKPLSTALVFIFLLFTAQTCKKQASGLAQAAFKHWVHSFEEDTADLKVYRPADYKFPLAEGRESFEIRQSGEFIEHRAGASDSPQKSTGTWRYIGKNTLHIQVQTPQTADYQLHLIQLSDTLLKVHKINK